MADTTIPAPAADSELSAITDLNLYVLVALGDLPALKTPLLPSGCK